MKIFLFPILLLISVIITACASKTGTFYFGALGANKTRIFIVNAVTNPVSYTVTMYDSSGNYIGVIADYSRDGIIPRGIAPYDAYSFMLALDTPDRLDLVSMFNTTPSIWGSNSQFTGNIYQIRRDSSGNYFTIESNTIEKFVNGQRSPTSGATPYLATTIGSCVLNTTRGLSFTSRGYLVAVGTGNDDIDVYDVSGVSPTCINANTSLIAGDNPMAVLGHTNGNIYVATNGTSNIYVTDGTASTAPVSIFNNTSIISAPIALAELPDGTLLVASDGTDSIERIDTNGNYIGGVSFIKNAFTTSVTDIMVLPAQ